MHEITTARSFFWKVFYQRVPSYLQFPLRGLLGGEMLSPLRPSAPVPKDAGYQHRQFQRVDLVRASSGVPVRAQEKEGLVVTGRAA